MAYAEHVFRLGVVQPDGASLGDHLSSGLEQMRRAGLKPKQPIVTSADAPAFPEPLLYLWKWYTDHSIGLPCSGMATPVVTWESLAAWCAVMRINLDAWEASAMVSLGMLRAKIASEKTKPNG